MTNFTQTGPRLSASTWSLHRSLGDPQHYGPEAVNIPFNTHNKGGISLLDVPAHLVQLGIHTLEICHFHLPSRAPGYLNALRGTLETNGVELWSLLVDAGDVTHPDHGQRDEAWVAGWIDVAQRLGAKRMRVIAGKAEPTDANLARSRDALLRLAEQAEAKGLRLMTENWFSLLSTPDAVNELLGSLDGRVGLCFDFGNWKGETKYADLAAIAQHAESCHAKPQFNADGSVEGDDYTRCLDITRDAGFAGPYTLIYDGPDWDELAGLESEKAIVESYCRAS
jgi:sugar phosphate isomerase/epimerase